MDERRGMACVKRMRRIDIILPIMNCAVVIVGADG